MPAAGGLLALVAIGGLVALAAGGKAKRRAMRALDPCSPAAADALAVFYNRLIVAELAPFFVRQLERMGHRYALRVWRQRLAANLAPAPAGVMEDAWLADLVIVPASTLQRHATQLEQTGGRIGVTAAGVPGSAQAAACLRRLAALPLA